MSPFITLNQAGITAKHDTFDRGLVEKKESIDAVEL
jgi:hypothetical protein